MINLQQQITAKITEALRPIHLEVINESGMHNVPKGSQTHFKVIVVANQFDGKTLLDRHQIINALLSEERDRGLHALALTTLTPEEWKKRSGKTAKTPPCLGGTKK